MEPQEEKCWFSYECIRVDSSFLMLLIWDLSPFSWTWIAILLFLGFRYNRIATSAHLFLRLSRLACKHTNSFTGFIYCEYQHNRSLVSSHNHISFITTYNSRLYVLPYMCIHIYMINMFYVHVLLCVISTQKWTILISGVLLFSIQTVDCKISHFP